jgi:hypothetical protein
MTYEFSGLQISYPYVRIPGGYIYNKSKPCEYYPEGGMTDYDPRCQSYYQETKQAFPHIILTNPYPNLANGSFTEYVGTLG